MRESRSDGPRRILVVEDDSARIARFRDELDGYALDVANSVAEALRLLSGPHYDLVFLDHDLEFGRRLYIDPYEENTGYQVVKYLVQEPAYADTPIVVHSYNWFGANKMVKALPCAVYVPFGIYPVGEIARLFLERGLNPRMKDLGRILGSGLTP
jgi:CheY-like chemotaxis protein